MIRILQVAILFVTFIMNSKKAGAQHERTQYPFVLSNNTYFEANFSYIGYHFSNFQMEPGYVAESVHIPHAAVRLVLYGYHFNKHLSAQITYMRPVLWVQYKNVNGDHSAHSVPMNIAGLTIKGQSPINNKFSLFAEAGLGIITPSGYSVNQVRVITNANYPGILVSTRFNYPVEDKMKIAIG